MRNPREDTIPRIRMLLKSLTDTEARVANYCIDAGERIYDQSIYDVARENGVSTALVVKLAKRFGYQGFKDFKNALIYSSQNDSQSYLHKLNKTDDPASVIQKVFNEAIVGLKHTELILDQEKLNLAATKISNASKIDIYGVGGSGAVAMDLFHKFMRIMIRAEMYTDSHLMAMSATGLDSTSVVIGVSHSGQTQSVVNAMGIAHEKNAYCIAITNTINSPICQVSDVCFCSVAESSPIVGENAAARVAMLTIIDVLYALVTQKNYNQTITNLEKTIASVKSLRVNGR